MTAKKLTQENDAEQVYEVSKMMSDNLMPEGTKYTMFNRKTDLEEGVEVVAKHYLGMRRGVITSVTDNGICEVNEQAVFINDVLYRIVE
jgi:hypothetical protein